MTPRIIVYPHGTRWNVAIDDNAGQRIPVAALEHQADALTVAQGAASWLAIPVHIAAHS